MSFKAIGKEQCSGLMNLIGREVEYPLEPAYVSDTIQSVCVEPKNEMKGRDMRLSVGWIHYL